MFSLCEDTICPRRDVQLPEPRATGAPGSSVAAERRMTDQALQRLSPRFERMYADIGRPSIAPEKLLRALLLQVLYTIRSERMLLEQLDYNLLFRWFVGLNMDDAVWVPTCSARTGTGCWRGPSPRHSLTRCCARRASRSCCRRSTSRWTDAAGGVGEPEELSEEGRAGGAAAGGSGQSHGGLPQREADQRNAPVDDRPGRSAGPEGQRQGGQAELRRARADGEPQRAGGECAADPGHRHRRAGSGRGDGERHSGPEAGDGGCRQELRRRSDLQQLRERKATPHVAQNQNDAIDSRTTRHPGYQIARARKKVEESFGWMKTVGLLRKLRHRGLERVGWIFTFTAAAFNPSQLVIGAGPPRVVGLVRTKRAGKGKRQGPKGPIARFTTLVNALNFLALFQHPAR